MQGNFFMQLLIILALLLYGGNKGANNLLEEVKPVLEEFGGEQVKEALKSAEEITKVLSVVKSFTADGADTKPAAQGAGNKGSADSFPLAPISNIADREITYALSEFVSAV